MNLFLKKNPLDSKGVIGGLVATVAFGIVATQLTNRTGVEVSKDEIKGVYDNTQLLVAQWGAWAALLASAVGLWGNWVRKVKVGFQEGKAPWKSKGIVGNLAGAIAGVAAFFSAVEADSETIEALIGQGKDLWTVAAPAALGIFGTVQGFWGRWRAQERMGASA